VADHDQLDDAWPLMMRLRDALEELDDAIVGPARVTTAPV
jgi:hypothetical protein